MSLDEANGDRQGSREGAAPPPCAAEGAVADGGCARGGSSGGGRREHLQRILGASDALLYHDDLATISTPFYFHEFIEHAAAHRLRFLAEAQLSDSQLRDVPARVGELIAGLPDDVVVREPYLDFFTNRMFRQTLLAHEAAPVRHEFDTGQIKALAISSPASRQETGFATPDGATMETSIPLVAAAMEALSDHWPQSLGFDELLARAAQRIGAERLAPDAVHRLLEVIADAYLTRLVLLHGSALPATRSPGLRPLASGLARAQPRAERPVLSTLLGGNCVLEEDLDRRLLPLLDGSLERGALATELAVSAELVEASLVRLAHLGLLCATRQCTSGCAPPRTRDRARTIRISLPRLCASNAGLIEQHDAPPARTVGCAVTVPELRHPRRRRRTPLADVGRVLR